MVPLVLLFVVFHLRLGLLFSAIDVYVRDISYVVDSD